MKLTLEEEIQIVQDTRGLPTGQRCMRLGYPEITLDDLEKRFAVHKLATAQNQQEEERVFRELAERARIHPTEAREVFTLHPDGRISDHRAQRRLWEAMGRTSKGMDLAALLRSDVESFWDVIPNRIPDSVMVMQQARAMGREQALRRDMERSAFAPPAMRGASDLSGIKYKKVTGFVKIMGLDEYMEEVIPERVLDSIQVAREAGLTSFKVAFPCLKVDEIETKQFDPVVFAELGKRWLEIDMWE